MLFASFAPLRPPASLRGTLRVAKWLELREALRAGLGVRFSSVYSLRLGVRSFGLSRGEDDLIGHDQPFFANAIPPSRSAVSGS
jgi:hypothetical protein